MNTTLTAQQLAQQNAQQALNLHQEASSLYTVTQNQGTLVQGPMTQAMAQTQAQAVANLRANLTAAVPVTIPQQTSKDEIYSTKKAKESMSAGKRKSRIETEGHPLNTKVRNAATVENIDAQKATQKATAIQVISGHPAYANLNMKEREEILKLCMSENPSVVYSRFEELMDPAKQYDALNGHVRELMAIDVSKIDISSDTRILEQSSQFERMGNLADGIKAMMKRLPEYANSLSREAVSLLEDKLKKITAFSDYYKAKKMLISDPYYSTHLNSECSVIIDPAATGAQNLAAHKIWICEAALKSMNIRQIPHRMDERLPDVSPALCARTLITHGIETEPGKNFAPPQTRAHATLLENIRTTRNDIRGQLDGQGIPYYHITGDTKASKESVVRHMHNFSWLKATSELSDDQLQKMLELISSRPSAALTAAEARENNIAGLKAFKLLLKNQTRYLMRKYGTGLSVSSITEFNEHSSDYAGDFANMQGFMVLMEYARTIPEVWEEDDELFLKQYNYITMTYFSQAFTKATYQGAPSIAPTFAASQRLAAENTVTATGLDIRLIDCAEAVKNEHSDIVWDAVMDVKEVGEILRDPELLAQRKKKYGAAEGTNPTDWLTYFPELKSLGSAPKDIVKKMIEELSAPQIAMYSTEWKNGLVLGAIKIPGIGTDDQSTVNAAYLRILNNPGAYNLSPADTQQLKGLLDQWTDISVNYQSTVYKNALTLELSFNPPATTEAPETIARARFFRALGDLSNDYTMESNAILAQNANTVRDQLLAFMLDHNLFTYDVHATAYQTEVTDKAAQLQKSEQFDMGNGVTVSTYPAIANHPGYSLPELLTNKKLKTGADANELQRAIDEANEIIPIMTALVPIIDESVDHENDLSQAHILDNVTTKKGFFLHDIFNRASVYGDRLLAIYDRIRGMVE